MSEDRLEKALEAMKSESVNPEQLAETRARVWEKLGGQSMAVCGEFQRQFQDYLDKQLSGNRLMLMEDHLGRCPQCRARLAELKGERKVVPMPPRASSWRLRWGTWAAVAALAAIALYLGRDSIDQLLAPGGPRATVISASGGLYLISKGTLEAGATVGENEVIRSGPRAHARLRLADGSVMDLNERTELSIHRVWSGQSIYLQRGDILVQAAKQHGRYLRVQTRDSIASVKGTIFAVSAGISGTVVSVIEGSVAVTQAGGEVVLKPGEQAASNPALAGSVSRAVSWNPDSEKFSAILTSLVHVQKQIAILSSQQQRTQSNLLQYIPANLVVYGAVPNLNGALSQATTMLEQQAAENSAVNQWWNSGAGQSLKQLIDRMQALTSLLGNEIVYGCSTGEPGTMDKIPMVLAEVQPDKRAELAAALEKLGMQTGQSYYLTDTMLVVSDSQKHLQWLLNHLGQGTATSFATEIAAHYQNGVGLLLGIDMDSILSSSGNAPEFVNAQQMKYIFLEQHNVQGIEENEMSITFKGPRTGLASLLANTGSGGAAEYVSSDVIAAAYLSTREPQQLFDELIAQLARSNPSLLSYLAQEEAKLGLSFSNDIARAFGTESALSFESFSAAGPVWVMATMVNDSLTLDRTIRKLMDVYNADLAKEGVAERGSLEQEVVDGRTWTTMKLARPALTVTWTYDRGYMVTSSDRGAALRALAIRNGGSPLIWSSAFQQQLPPSAGLHPSGFFWLNTKGVFQSLAALIPNPAIQKLAAEGDPILVVVSGTAEQIHAASRTRLLGLMLDMMMLQGLGQTRPESQATILRQGQVRAGIR